jgi:5-methyltetrahydrofolate--homocysteine methyltransferase
VATDFLERLQYDVLISWVPLHTLLVDWGKDLESHLSEWIINHPEEFQDAQKQSLDAGVDLTFTATQAASPWRAETFGLRDRIYEFNFESARLAKEVTPRSHYVCGNVSTTNPDFLGPIGNMTYDEVYEGYKVQISALIEGGADIIMVSGNHLEEGVIAIKVAKDLADIPVVVQNVFYATKKGFRTMMGVDAKAASARSQDAGADVIGANCGLMTKSIDSLEWCPAATALVKEMRQGCDKPLAMQPDPGVPQLIDSKTVWPVSPEQMASEVPNWIDAGAFLVGGCCGTNLEHYRQILAKVREWRRAKNL